uniref:SUN domain-containing protein n=1 Tax=Caenorhabditis tropicalis TaxID=1561998 RepID=A0A1I7UB44_9PELO
MKQKDLEEVIAMTDGEFKRTKTLTNGPNFQKFKRCVLKRIDTLWMFISVLILILFLCLMIGSKQFCKNEKDMKKGQIRRSGLDGYEVVLVETKKTYQHGELVIVTNVYYQVPDKGNKILEPIEMIDEKQAQLRALYEKSLESKEPSGLINAANAVNGAYVIDSQSSKTVSVGEGVFDRLDTYFQMVDSGSVLLDRVAPFIGKAWCSIEDTPVLTIKLSTFIKPTAVSYKHTPRWVGTVPDGAPKLYNVVGCLNEFCNVTTVLASTCEYKTGDYSGMQEQYCEIPQDPLVPFIDRIQIILLENHGNVEKTCAYLFRVFGEPEGNGKKEIAQVDYAKRYGSKFSKMNCTELAWLHKNARLIYDFRDYTCPLLYAKNNCCIECPQCCITCHMKMGMKNHFNNFLLWLISVFTTITIIQALYFFVSLLPQKRSKI